MVVSVPLELLRSLMALAMEAPVAARVSLPTLQQADMLIQAAQKPPAEESAE